MGKAGGGLAEQLLGGMDGVLEPGFCPDSARAALWCHLGPVWVTDRTWALQPWSCLSLHVGSFEQQWLERR